VAAVVSSWNLCTLGDEYGVDLLESRETVAKSKPLRNVSSLEDGLHFLAKQN